MRNTYNRGKSGQGISESGNKCTYRDRKRELILHKYPGERFARGLKFILRSCGSKNRSM